MITQHAPLPPSGGFQWRYCPGSIVMQALAMAAGQTAASIEGDAAHWTAEQLYHGVTASSLVGKPAPNGHVITEEIIKHVMIFVETIRAIVERYPDAEVWIEYTTAIDSVHPDCWGTFDCAIYIPSLKLLYILDLKYGWGIVEAFDNEQLNLYGLGFVEELITKHRRPVDNIKVGIVQPRAYHSEGSVRIVDLPKQDLIPFRAEMIEAAKLAVTPGAPCKTGTHCKNCDARYMCPALRHAVDHGLDFIDSAQPEELSPEDLGQYLHILRNYSKLFSARLKSLESRAEALIELGQPVLGHSIGPGRGSRDWNRPDDEMKMIGQLIEVPFSKEVMLSPNQVENLGVAKDIVAQYTKTIRGKPKLLTVDPSILAKRIFKQ